ncbi:hypothetical protein [Burkholderia ambifaria]|jgi:hypothetical protein|uniref:hypothetical protein n=1 Tax=Burkholderia ambifaria TaxID=152480 RepID=UPI00158D6759|nr:hypothetical protein [Burkholderia ambifaria]
MTIIYSNPNFIEMERRAIRREIRASNAESMARRRARDEAERQAVTLRRVDRAFSLVRFG